MNDFILPQFNSISHSGNNLIHFDLFWIGKFPTDDMWMCENQKRSPVSGRTRRPYSFCMDSMARHGTHICDIWKTVKMTAFHQPCQRNNWKKTIWFSFRMCTAYLSRNFNVVLVDWKKLTYYPCYFSALGNTKLVAQCTAQVNNQWNQIFSSEMLGSVIFAILYARHYFATGVEWYTKQD